MLVQNENVAVSLEPNKPEEDQKKEPKEIVIQGPQSTMIQKLINDNNISLQIKQQNIMGGRKTEEQKTEMARKIQVRKVTTALFLQNNQFRSIQGLRSTLDDVMWTPNQLQWLDLSYNYLENIEVELLNFPQLKTLYLHGNYFNNLEQVKKLNQYDDLQSLTLFGNPIE